MTRTKKLADNVSVCTFVSPGELPALAREFKTIINNRPDGEEQGQATSAQLEEAARKAGLDYVHIPVIPGQIGDDQVARFAEALAARPGHTLAFCRTGTRSASLWALSQAGTKGSDEILEAAKDAGYDLTALKPRLDTKRATE